MAHPAERMDVGVGVDLGPARVLRGGSREVEIKLEHGGPTRAQLALALPYVAVEDDVVLVLSKGDRHYVVGVLDGSGKTALSFGGDVALSARGGSLTLEADRGVEIRSPKIALQTRSFEVVAETVVQRARELYQRVNGLLTTHAGRTHTQVDETAFAQSKRAAIVTEESIHINGEQIHLG